MSDYDQASADAAFSFRIDAAAFSPLPAKSSAESPSAESTNSVLPQLPPETGVGLDAAAVHDRVQWPVEELDSETPGREPGPPVEVLNASIPISEADEETKAPFDSTPPPAKPAWEVDKLRWPAVCDRLLDQESEYFSHAGQKLYDASQQGLKILAVTSSGPGEGCTTLSVCLARAVAATGARVALIDGDVQNSQLSSALGLDLPAGWLEAAAGIVPWTEAAVSALEGEITVLPGASTTAGVSPGEITGAADVLREIAEQFDLVVLDIGPLAADARYLWKEANSSIVDAAIVVRDCRMTSETKTLAVTAKLKALGVQAVGIAENYTSATPAIAAA